MTAAIADGIMTLFLSHFPFPFLTDEVSAAAVVSTSDEVISSAVTEVPVVSVVVSEVAVLFSDVVEVDAVTVSDVEDTVVSVASEDVSPPSDEDG